MINIPTMMLAATWRQVRDCHSTLASQRSSKHSGSSMTPICCLPVCSTVPPFLVVVVVVLLLLLLLPLHLCYLTIRMTSLVNPSIFEKKVVQGVGEFIGKIGVKKPISNWVG